MEFRAQFVHRSDQGGDVFRRRELRDAVTEIEYVAGSAPEGFERVSHFPSDRLRRCEQHRGIDIALKGRASADPPAHPLR